VTSVTLEAAPDAWAEQDAWADRKQFINPAGLEIAYVEISGAEPALVLVHGFTDTSRSFSLLAPHLAGRRLIMPDLRGHGASSPGKGFGIADFADDIAALIRHLQLDQPVVVGHSLGAMVAIALAARYKELIGGLVVMAGGGLKRPGTRSPRRTLWLAKGASAMSNLLGALIGAAIDRSGLLPKDLVALVNLRVALINGCPF